MRVIQVIDHIDFSEMREAERAEAYTIYRINNFNRSETYAISPDGIGFYFYATLDELEAEH